MELGGQIKSMREAFEMTREQFSTLLGVHSSTLYRWESSSRPNPDPLQRSLLAAIEILQERHSEFGVKHVGSVLKREVTVFGHLRGIYRLLQIFYGRGPI